MGICEICGKQAVLGPKDIEGVEIQACGPCGGLQQSKSSYKRKAPRKSLAPKKELDNIKVRDNFADLIKKAREDLGKSQAEFAQHINERESVLSKWEAGTLKPAIHVAQRLARQLKVSFTQKDVPQNVDFKKSAGKEMTIADMITIKKRSKK